MCNTTVYQAFGSYLRSKNGKLQKRFSFRPTTEQEFLKKSQIQTILSTSPPCASLIQPFTAVTDSSRRNFKAVQLHHPPGKCSTPYDEAEVSLGGQNELLGYPRLGISNLHHPKRAPLFARSLSHQGGFPADALQGGNWAPSGLSMHMHTSGSSGLALFPPRAQNLKKTSVDLHMCSVGTATGEPESSSAFQWKTILISSALTHCSVCRALNEVKWEGAETGGGDLSRAHFKSFPKGIQTLAQPVSASFHSSAQEFSFSEMTTGSTPQSGFMGTCFQGALFTCDSNCGPSRCTAFIFQQCWKDH